MAIVFLMDDTKLSVRGEVPEHLAGKVAVGQKARVIFDSLGGLKLDGEIMTVGRTVRRKSMNSLAMIREFSIKLDNTLLPESIKMGVSAQITIDTEIQGSCDSRTAWCLGLSERIPRSRGAKWLATRIVRTNKRRTPYRSGRS